MRALIWKEWRENFRWALLAMLALGGAEYFALHRTDYPGQMDIYFNDGITLCKNPFLAATLFGCAAVGLALGFLQVLPELKRDRWAALLHRPVSRGQFFWGKAVAGVGLYGMAAGAPFLFSVWWVATPGHFGSPFLPAMIQPSLADLICGLSYYFAALLAGLQGGSIALRALPLLAAARLSFFALGTPFFRVAVEAAVAMALVLCVAGWGAIYAREGMRGRPWIGRLALVIVAFYGARGLGRLAETVGAVGGAMGDQKYSRWEVLEDGVPARLDHVNNVVVSVTGANGQAFANPDYAPERVRNHLASVNQASFYVGDSHGWKMPTYDNGYRQSYTYLSPLQAYSYPRLEQWFHLERENRFVGFSPVEKRAFATLGEAGFAPPSETAPAFPKDVTYNETGGDSLVLAENNSLRLANLAQRAVTPLALPAPGPIYGMGYASVSIGDGSVEFEGVALRAGVAVYGAKGRMVAMLPYRRDIERWGEISIGVLKSMDRFVLEYGPNEWIAPGVRLSMPSYLEDVDAEGHTLASFELAPLPHFAYPPLRSAYLSERLQNPVFFLGEMLYRRIGAAFGSERLRDALAEQLGPRRRETFAVGRILLLLALVLATLTFAWARRAQLPARRAWAWALLVLGFGLPGLIVFWLAGERPGTVRCPVCGRPRRIDREHCARCLAAWPASDPDGTEIIDREPASPAPVAA